MFRKDFLKKLLGLAGLAILPIKMILPQKRTWLLQFHVRGFQFYQGPDNINRMEKGDELTLVREPKNQYDQDAIALYYRNQKIGFVPREKNEVISRLLDSGYATIKAEIIDVDSNIGPWDAVYAGIYLEKQLMAA